MQPVNALEIVAVIKGYTKHIDRTELKQCVGRRMHTNVSTLLRRSLLYLEHISEADYKQTDRSLSPMFPNNECKINRDKIKQALQSRFSESIFKFILLIYS